MILILRTESIYINSRNLFSRNIWKCCRSLFSLGPLERRDAYHALSLCLSFSSCMEGFEKSDASVQAEEFDVKAETEFWDEIKRGLVLEHNFSLFPTMICRST